MRLNDDLPRWVMWPLRSVFYALVLYIVFAIAQSVASARLQSNIEQCLSDSRLVGTSPTQNRMERLRGCLDQKNGILEKLATSPGRKAIDALSHHPVEFVGHWNWKQPHCHYKYEMAESGEYIAEPVKCSYNNKRYTGTWGILDNQMVWLHDSSSTSPIEFNPIEESTKDAFVIIENDGSRTHFTRISDGTATLATSESLAQYLVAGAPLPEDATNLPFDGVVPHLGVFTESPDGSSNGPLPLPSHFSHAIGNSTDVLWTVWDSKRNQFYRSLRWNPATGNQREYVVPEFDTVVDTGDGLMFDSSIRFSNPATIRLVTDDGKTLTTRLSVTRERPHMLVLTDRSVLVIGGSDTWDSRLGRRVLEHSNAVERVIYRNGQLDTERLPDLPGPERTAFGMVALPNNRAMILGGSDSAYVGCKPCIAETYLLDVAAKRWIAGPSMLEARADPTVTALPDGSILVAGGWTKPGNGDGGRGATSATTERWRPGSGRFEPGKPLPTGTAGHRAVWAAGREGKTLVLAGGNSAAVQTYDVAHDSWQVAAELCEPHQTENVFPFSFGGNSYLWLMDGKAGWCKEGRYDDGPHKRTLVSLHQRAQRFDPQVGIALNRSRFAFVPGANDTPSYVVGGAVNSVGQPNIADAYAIYPEGRIVHVAPSDVPQPNQVDLATLPPLTKARRSAYGSDRENMVIRKLPDGRAIVAGGEVQEHKIALVTEDSMTSGTPDTYIGIGEYLPSYYHEIYDPGAGIWRNSEPSGGAGGPVAIFDDGRVVKVSRQKKRSPPGTETQEEDKYLLEISSQDGRRWTRLDDPPVIKMSDDTRPFVIQNELFLSGRLPEKGGGSGSDAVMWLNTELHQWETLWQIPSGDNWRFHIGRIIVRALPNGKRIVIPVGGF